jgi:hypothetical protein
MFTFPHERARPPVIVRSFRLEAFNAIETRDRFSGNGFPFNRLRFQRIIEIRFGQSKSRRKNRAAAVRPLGVANEIGDGGENDS